MPFQTDVIQYQNEVILGRVIASSTTSSQGFPLAGGASTQLTRKTVAGYGAITGYVFADVAGVLTVQQTIDGSNYDIGTEFPVIAGAATPVDVPVYGTQARISYTNGAGAQAAFRMNVVAKPMAGEPSSSSSGGSIGTGLVIANTSAVLGIGGTFTTSTYQLGSTTTGARFAAYDIIKGFAQSDKDGTVLIEQALASADIGTANVQSSLTFNLTGGSTGLQFTNTIVAPFVAIVFTNTSGAVQTQFRFYAMAES